jgi:hypothetical protein
MIHTDSSLQILRAITTGRDRFTVSTEDLTAYFRTNPREWFGRSYTALTLADIVVPIGKRGHGLFSNLILETEFVAQACRFEAVLIENARDSLVKPLTKRGYMLRTRGYLLAGGGIDLLKEIK